MVVVAAATPPTLTSKGSSPAGTSGIWMFICSRPSVRPGASPANWTVATTPPTVTCTVATGKEKGLAGATSPVVTVGLTSPWPVRGVEASIGEVECQDVVILLCGKNAGTGGRHLEVHRGTGQAVGLDDQLCGADFGFIGDLRVDLPGTDV
jgi:hypothetical protein